MSRKMDIQKHLFCPDCSSRLVVFNEELRCSSCGRIFSREGRFLNLLPINLSKVDLAEEQFWATDSREGIEAHPLFALLVKKDSALYFHEKILPEMALMGRILEIGSGSCWLSSLIKLAYPSLFLIASDVAPSALLKGIQVSEFLDSPIDWFIACKAESLPFEDKFFDFVIGSAILHHTDVEPAICEIFRVLNNQGVYIGIQELAIPRMLSYLWGRFGLAGQRQKELGVKEGNYSLNQWKRFFRSAGFEDVKISFERDPLYKQYHWFTGLYYNLISRLPDVLVKHCLASSIRVTARKRIE